jgi:hypothetical protein
MTDSRLPPLNGARGYKRPGCRWGGGRGSCGLALVTHRRARIGVPGSNLDLPQVHARVEHGGDEGGLIRPVAGRPR